MSTESKQLKELPIERKQRIYEEIDKVIDSYRDKDGSLIQILHLAQEIYGYLPLELQRHISDKTGIPFSEISGVVSFYSFFSTAPRGEHTVRVCMGTACYVRGGKKIVEHLQDKLDVELGGTTADGKLTFELARCIGACGLAPALTVDETVYKQANMNKAEKILNKY